MSASGGVGGGLITLRGSAELVSEYFGYCINSILYQRSIYDPDTFTTITKYGLRLQVTQDAHLQQYLNQVMKQLTGWLTAGTVKRLVCVVSGVDTEQVMERWTFDVDTDEKAVKTNGTSDKPIKEIHAEIGAILRQVTSCVSFLPLIEVPCTFDLLVYTSADCSVPLQWEESDPRHIHEQQCSQVKLRSFNTNIHKVDTMVTYRVELQ